MTTIQGTEIRRITENHKTVPRIPLTPIMAIYYHNVELAVIFLLVNGSPFLHIKPKKIDFR